MKLPPVVDLGSCFISEPASCTCLLQHFNFVILESRLANPAMRKLEDLIKDLPQGVTPSTIQHFSRIPLAQPTLQDPSFRPFPSSRSVTNDGRGHTLTGRTWNTPSTITEKLSFHRPSSAPPGSAYPHPEDVRSEVRRFYTFGSDLNAHPDLLHGGVIATILDSSLGTAIGRAFPGAGTEGMFTVQLNVGYKKPVRTPGTVRVRAWAVRVEGVGRKVWAEGVVESEGGEGEAVVHARAEGLWLRGKGKGKEGGKL